MRKILSLAAVLALSAFLLSCTVPQSRGAGVGAGVGGVAGALLDRENPWRGGVIGATLGAKYSVPLSPI